MPIPLGYRRDNKNRSCNALSARVLSANWPPLSLGGVACPLAEAQFQDFTSRGAQLSCLMFPGGRESPIVSMRAIPWRWIGEAAPN